ncbi:ArnT family glycosyltransferase [Synoicihabitans lomoniglobus]|uniref:Glycosyltransferase family 39 protein n=1 Tax=Synoicihabitans lomoniglobus TaxID=2909285 RepID=A0AAE9ZY51_9BACT|nr:glycosyltransferase family 39 protein [Opitutaceae bacterium LMO-M01]WED65741.1 glycosyltransferase family 39 protein [Opitutaceae bacterium LMO-M01]
MIRPHREIIGRARATWIAVVLCGLHVLMAASVSRQFSTTFDEIAHVTAGYAYWTAGDMRFQPENGNFPQRWAALPLLIMDLQPFPPDHPAWEVGQVWHLGEDFFYELGNDSARILAAARGMIALLSGALCFTIFCWSRDLFGPAGGLVSVTLAAFSPTLLAHGGLATSDTAAALSFGLATLAWWRVCHRVTLTRIVVAGLAAGLLAVSKFSAVLFAPMAIIMIVARLLRRAPLVAVWRGSTHWVRGGRRVVVLGGVSVVAVLIAWSCIWACYGFRYRPTSNPDHQYYMHTWEMVTLADTPTPRLLADGRNASAQPVNFKPGPLQAIAQFCRSHELFPEAFLHGLLNVDRYSRSRLAFFAGEFRNTGWWTFFPTAFLLKTTGPALLLIFLGTLACSQLRSRRGRWYRLVPLLALFGIYGSTILTSSLSIGHRHMLPLYPVMFIFAGAAALRLIKHRGWMLAMVVVLLGSHVAVSLTTRPYYLAYFNALGGGPENAHKIFVDSSLDWGQDLPSLRDWLTAHRTEQPVFLSYFGYGDPEQEGIDAVRFGDSYFDRRARVVPAKVQGGIYCISATMYQQVYTPTRGAWTLSFEATYAKLRTWVQHFSQRPAGAPITDMQGNPLTSAEVTTRLWNYEALQFGRLCHYLQNRAPDDYVGYSILVYELSDADINLAVNSPLAAVNAAIAARYTDESVPSSDEVPID